MRRLTFLEFFAGGGMARAGLSADWRCLFANDVDPKKCASYRANFGAGELLERSIVDLVIDDLPMLRADLAWASFPCQDLSLAGLRSGMGAPRSGLFHEFWRLISGLASEMRAPRIIVLENVAGLATSNGGEDFRTIVSLMNGAGYRIGAAMLDAKDFTPQSRPRLFIVGFANDVAAPACADEGANAMLAAGELADRWIDLPLPQTRRNARFGDIVDWDAPWDAPAKTSKLIAMMAAAQRGRINALIRSGARRAGTGFRRTRVENGKSVQRFEARFDGLAGCLRTPAGGSSRQIVIAVDKGKAMSRLMTPEEAARLMGLPDDYLLPASVNGALKLCGDGVCVPVVRWLAENVLEPGLRARRAAKDAEAA